VVEVRDLLSKMEVLKQGGAALTCLEGVLIVVDGQALIGRQRGG
jgi:ribosome-associated protein YbcJ (S4-like RNA binding protein)